MQDVFKKLMEASIGFASVAAEKMTAFAEEMAKKGQEFKEINKEDIEKFFNTIKIKFEEASSAFNKILLQKDERISFLEKEIENLKKEIEEIKAKLK